MCHHMLTHCGLKQILNLDSLDCLTMIISAACHDLGHDGFTNSYHVNAITSRAIDSNDVSVQESFHVSEIFRMLGKSDQNFTVNMSKEDFKIFRKRSLGLILSTDMARHSSDLTALK